MFNSQQSQKANRSPTPTESRSQKDNRSQKPEANRGQQKPEKLKKMKEKTHTHTLSIQSLYAQLWEPNSWLEPSHAPVHWQSKVKTLNNRAVEISFTNDPSLYLFPRVLHYIIGMFTPLEWQTLNLLYRFSFCLDPTEHDHMMLVYVLFGPYERTFREIL